jgi:hypothetical protein
MSEASAVGLAKIGNAELAYFNKQMLIHELIRGSLTLDFLRPGRSFTDNFITVQVAEFEIPQLRNAVDPDVRDLPTGGSIYDLCHRVIKGLCVEAR